MLEADQTSARKRIVRGKSEHAKDPEIKPITADAAPHAT